MSTRGFRLPALILFLVLLTLGLWSLSNRIVFKSHHVPAAVETVRSLVQGRREKGESVPLLSYQAFHELAKLRQEVFCRDSMPIGVKPAGDLTLVGDLQNTSLVRLKAHTDKNVYIALYPPDEDFVSPWMAKGVQWEGYELQQLLWALQASLPKGANPTSTFTPALFVDIGANIGAFTLDIAARGYEVIAFEGMSGNQRLLHMSLCYSDPVVSHLVTLHNFGLGDSRKTCYIVSDDANKGNGNAICDAQNEMHALRLANFTPVKGYRVRGTMNVEKLDDVLKRDVKAMKLDVEGFEPFVVAGGWKLFREHTVWFLLMEYNQASLANTLKGMQPIDFLLDLVLLGYKISRTAFQGPFMEDKDLHQLTAEPNLITNLYLVHKRFYAGA